MHADTASGTDDRQGYEQPEHHMLRYENAIHRRDRQPEGDLRPAAQGCRRWIGDHIERK